MFLISSRLTARGGTHLNKVSQMPWTCLGRISSHQFDTVTVSLNRLCIMIHPTSQSYTHFDNLLVKCHSLRVFNCARFLSSSLALPQVCRVLNEEVLLSFLDSIVILVVISSMRKCVSVKPKSLSNAFPFKSLHLRSPFEAGYTKAS
jgi:hypothetical protein